MKLNAALAKTLLMAASIGAVVPVLADTTVVHSTADSTTPPATPDAPRVLTQKPAPAKPAGTKTDSAKPTSTKPTPAKPGTTAADKAQKTETAAEIPGITQARSSGGFIGIEVDGGRFKISFYDKEKKPISADVARGTARWDTHKKIHQDRTVLNPSDDGKALRGAEFVSPPYNFILFLTLLDADGNAVENYSIPMQP